MLMLLGAMLLRSEAGVPAESILCATLDRTYRTQLSSSLYVSALGLPCSCRASEFLAGKRDIRIAGCRSIHQVCRYLWSDAYFGLGRLEWYQVSFAGTSI